MVLHGAILLLGCLAACRLRGSSLAAAIAYLITNVVHAIATLDKEAWPGPIYYLSAGTADFLILVVLTIVRPVPSVVHGLSWVCVASIAANAYGLVIWSAYWPPDSYDALHTVIYTSALWILAGGNNDMADSRSRWRVSFPRLPFSARNSSRTKSKTGVQP